MLHRAATLGAEFGVLIGIDLIATFGGAGTGLGYSSFFRFANRCGGHQATLGTLALAAFDVAVYPSYHLGYGIGAGGTLHTRLTDGGGAANALELVQNFIGVDAGTQSNGNQPCGGLTL